VTRTPSTAICYGVRGGGVQLAFHLQPGNYNTDTLIQVLAELRRFLGGERRRCCGMGCLSTAAAPCGPGWWLSGCRPTHPSWTGRRLVVVAEGAELANLVCPTLQAVVEQAERGIQRVRQTPHLAYWFLRRTGLSVS
jgi:hypothetical protein